MVPHKDPSILPIDDQVKLVRDKLDEIAWDLATVKTKQRVQDDTLNVIRIDLKGTRSDIKGLAKQFRNQDQKFDSWKSKIHTLIDKGFTSKAKILDDEVGVLNTRTVDLRKRVEKLETQQFATS